MKNTGIVRKVDELGRIVIPIEIRKKLEIAEKDDMEIYTEGDKIILKKVVNSCILCGNNKKLNMVDDKLICDKCIDKIVKAMN